jgi:hypothetical protein
LFKLAAIVAAVIVIVQVGKSIAEHASLGCGRASAAADVAHADTSACPADIAQAVRESSWAAQQRQVMQDARVTSGRYITNQASDPQAITSGWNAPPGISDRIVGLLRNSPNFPNFPSSGKPNVAGDVETKVAMVMREAGATSAVVAINHPQMCDGVMGCKGAVTAILPKGSVLYVWELDAAKAIECDGEATCH